MPPLVNLSSLIDDAKCYELVRQHRWPDGVRCPHCESAAAARHGRDDTQPHRQRYRCTACGSRFDDLTGTILAGHHQPLRVWVLCLYFMGLNLSNRQIAKELDLGTSDVQVMTEQLRQGLTARTRTRGKSPGSHGLTGLFRTDTDPICRGHVDAQEDQSFRAVARRPRGAHRTPAG